MRTGHDFSRYKRSTIRRRLQRRMCVNHISDLADYASFLKENEDEVKALLKYLLIGVTISRASTFEDRSPGQGSWRFT
jgi:two-component system CheB/CheR fusion protein